MKRHESERQIQIKGIVNKENFMLFSFYQMLLEI